MMPTEATRRTSRISGLNTFVVVRDIWLDLILNENRFAYFPQGVLLRQELQE